MCGPGMWPALISSRKGYVGEAVRAYVADGGEAGFESGFGVFYSDDSFLPGRHGELEVRVEVIGHGEVGCGRRRGRGGTV